jgi:thioredoxin reductase
LRLLWERAVADPAIEYRAETPLSSVNLDETPPERGGETVGRLKLWTEAGESLKADFLLFAIGRIPQVSFLPDEILNNRLDGVYFVGDVKNGRFRQAAIAAGDGLRAAMEIYTHINLEAQSL